MKSIHRVTGLEAISVISCIGIIAWLLTDLFGGMLIFLLSYYKIILIIILLYLISIIDFISCLKNQNWDISPFKLIPHSLVFLTVILINLHFSELIKSPAILIAHLHDDLSSQELVFRENGIVENKVSGIFGYSEQINGEYRIENNLIIFLQKPYDNDFIPDTLLLDKSQHALFLNKKNNEFERAKIGLNYFEIEFMDYEKFGDLAFTLSSSKK